MSNISILAANKIIHSERSLYRNILVTENYWQRCLQFTIKKDQRSQSCTNRHHPKEMVFPYTKMMMASLLVTPKPKRILIIGLGGGTLPMALADLLPESDITVVEIDAAVVKVASDYFSFNPSEQISVVVQDARVFGRRALIRQEKYDLIMLDAYNGDYIPEHLLSQEYLQECRMLLSESGVLTANTFSISKLYHSESTTYKSVFNNLLNFKSNKSANRILIASIEALPSRQQMKHNAKALAPLLKPYGIPIQKYPYKLDPDSDWNTNARVLTDQHSPANLLNAD
ncbi:MAG: fused MFS/spermidine synthase [Pseudomonadales bacterium]|nr:fused MFS/spermidine synthase [Pseudomonadales bacterium]